MLLLLLHHSFGRGPAASCSMSSAPPMRGLRDTSYLFRTIRGSQAGSQKGLAISRKGLLEIVWKNQNSFLSSSLELAAGS